MVQLKGPVNAVHYVCMYRVRDRDRAISWRHPIMTATFGALPSSGNPFQRSNSIPVLPDFQLFHIRVHKKQLLAQNLILAAVLRFQSSINVGTIPIKNIDLTTIRLVICTSGRCDAACRRRKGDWRSCD
jgi:hypothetical protein